MQMTDTEILGKYNRSDDKKGVVQILADLNGCDKDTIQQILIQGVVPESEFTPKKRRKKPSPAVKEPEYKEAPAGNRTRQRQRQLCRQRTNLYRFHSVMMIWELEMMNTVEQ